MPKAWEYATVYTEFCDKIIWGQLIKKQEIFRMKKLSTLFQKMIRGHHGHGSYRSDLLKKRLRQDFPQLNFYKPPRKNLSEMVFTEATGLLNKGTSTETESSGSQETLSSGGETVQESGTYAAQQDRTRIIYSAGIILKQAVKSAPNISANWPPTSEDLNISSARKIVPIELYNLLAWCIGVSDELTLSNMVNVSEEVDLRLLSICQDIIYLSSKGRNQTPKSLTLGLTLRHLTGSFQVVNLVSKLGHCASWESVVGLETSLAQLQLSRGLDLPQGFASNNFTVLVWDNIDFGEETSSGKGTTHHTNGIMIQRKYSETLIPQAQVEVKKGVRSLNPQELVLEVYRRRPRQGPGVTDKSKDSEDIHVENLRLSKSLDFAYILSKFTTCALGIIPGWTGFNIALTKGQTCEKSVIYYLPVIEASPTEMTTVNTILKRSIERADQLQLPHIVLVFDLAIYAKAQEIRWLDDDIQKRVVIRLGEFHTCMSFLGMIGKRFGDAGLSDLLVEADIVAKGSVNGVISGHHYNRSIRAHKLLYEALQRLRFANFVASLPDEESERINQVMETLKTSYHLSPMSVFDLIQAEDFQDIMSCYQKYVDTKSESSPTFALWSSYLDIVQVLLSFIRATRESNWNLHISTLKYMLPWYFAYDHINYARYLPVYWLEMMNLSDTHPACYEEISEKRNWTVQRQDAYGFSSIACDQAIEQTCNRDTKTSGGLKGITLNRGATQRWVLAQPHRAAITRQCESMAGLSHETRSSKELDLSRMKKNESDIRSIINSVDSMINPFEYQGMDLVCLSSGAVATEEIKTDLLAAKLKGEMAVDQYISERLVTNKTDVFRPLKMMKLKTFKDLQKKPSKKSSKDSDVKNDRNIFARLLIIGQNSKVDLHEILSYSLGPVSYPLAADDGTKLAKTNKAALLNFIEEKVTDCLFDGKPDDAALMIDGMAVLQSVSSVPSTFGELADRILQVVISLACRYSCRRVDFVTDRYPTISIKNIERSRRSSSGTQKTSIYSKDQKTPKQWNKFLSDGDNKESLVEFLFSVWKDADLSSLKQDIAIFVAHGKDCHLLRYVGGKVNLSVVPELTLCDHEEADTRLLLHANHAAKTFSSVIIRSPDTDVAVIAISLKSCLPAHLNLFFLTGTQQHTRMIDIGRVASFLGVKISEALIGLHVFTGCDSVSAFFGKGKKKALELLMKEERFCDAFIKLGHSFDLEDRCSSELERFVCHLYGQQVSNVNEARYNLFCVSSPSEKLLPPTKDALYQHSLRANYQAAIHRRSLEQQICAPSPESHGWILEGWALSIKWMTIAAAPDVVLKTPRCSCKVGKCSQGKCSCLKAKVSCFFSCKCVDCENRNATPDELSLQTSESIDEMPDSESDESDFDYS